MELTTDFAMRHEKTLYGYAFLITVFVDITLVYEGSNMALILARVFYLKCLMM